MPVYVYRVAGEKMEVSHKMSHDPQTWGELCEAAGMDLGERDPGEKVERLIVPVGISVAQFTSDYKNSGFKRLERRDSGVY